LPGAKITFVLTTAPPINFHVVTLSPVVKAVAENALVVTSNTPTKLAKKGTKTTLEPTATAPQNLLSSVKAAVVAAGEKELSIASNTPTKLAK